MTSTTWKTLLEKLGDRGNSDWQASWQTFVELYRPLLERYVRAVSKTYGHAASDAEVEEMVQDIFIRLSTVMSPSAEATDGKPAHRPFSLDHARGRFRSWLYTLTRNKVLDHLRKKRGHAQQLPEGDILEKPEEPPEEWGRDYQARVLEYALPKIKPTIAAKSWHCFEQYFLKNRKAAEITRDPEVAGLTSNAICVNALRVLERVRTKCGELMGELDV
jgi:RNA polymerase sigma factor (sigma-70 family)